MPRPGKQKRHLQNISEMKRRRLGNADQDSPPNEMFPSKEDEEDQVYIMIEDEVVLSEALRGRNSIQKGVYGR
jgi:hypothetical protein